MGQVLVAAGGSRFDFRVPSFRRLIVNAVVVWGRSSRGRAWFRPTRRSVFFVFPKARYFAGGDESKFQVSSSAPTSEITGRRRSVRWHGATNRFGELLVYPINRLELRG